MKLVTVKEMAELEQRAIAAGMSTADLMERAGRGMAERIAANFPGEREALVVVGKGNNGGDGLVVARYLAEANWKVRVAIVEGEKSLRDLPREQLKRLTSEQPTVMVHGQLHESLFPGAGGVLVDALLGVGSAGPLRTETERDVEKMNKARVRHFFRTVALDVPSGLPGDPEHAVIADLTIAAGAAKDFLVREEFSGRVGRIEVVPLFDEIDGDKDELLIDTELSSLLPRRSAFSHKNTYGRALVVGGSTGFVGAPLLTAQAALRAGAGLVNLAVAKSIYPIVATRAPAEIMVSAIDRKLSDLLESVRAVAVGPGLGTDRAAVQTLTTVLKESAGPIVVDADALTILAAKPALFKQAKQPLILTPHPGEMRRLVGRDFSVGDRTAVASEFSDRHHCVVILKGTRTVVAIPGQPLYYNSTGNPGLAVGGSGDTLTGLIVGLLSQGLKPGDAAKLAVFWHGRAADVALMARGCEEGILSGDVCECLGKALVSIRQG